MTNRNQITATANTSKKPSTHRCTTHQRQYSTIDRWVCSPHISRRRRTGRSQPSTGTAGRRSTRSSLRRSAGQSARPTSSSHSIRPTNRNICQKRPISMYSQPWWPNQKLFASPSFCITANHWPANAPTTMTSRQTNRKFTPRRWNFGSCPETAGPMYRPVASQAVAIHSTASCVCQRARQRVRQDLGQVEAVEHSGLDLVVRGDRAEQDLRQEQRDHDPEVFGRRLHRRRDRRGRAADRCAGGVDAAASLLCQTA